MLRIFSLTSLQGLLPIVLCCTALGDDALRLSVVGQPDQAMVRLSDPDASQQLQVTQIGHRAIDVTRQAQYRVQPSGVVHIDDTGLVTPLRNGTCRITVSTHGTSTSIPATVTGIDKLRPISFPNDIVPQLTRAGCNSGACHGTPSGKNNFRLSLLGFEPRSDYDFLTKESRGRRISPTLPEASLLLRKASGSVPHGGGARMKRRGPEYKLLRRWIAAGLPYGPDNDPLVERIVVTPADRVVDQRSNQQLVVTAYFNDGTTRDITRVAEYKANQPDMCQVDHHGLVQFKDRTGTTSVMIRFQEHMGAFMATIPLGKPTPNLPQPRNFVDAGVFEKLATLGLPPSAECDDATFLRRVTIDLSGRLPTLAETKSFLASQDANKRANKVDQLLDSPGYADLFASKWAAILRNKSAGGLDQVSRETFGFHSWIRAGLSANQPFDQFVTQLVTARGKPGTNPAVSWYRAVKDPKDQMADIAQIFLGVRIQCAQCHHHPYEKWSQDDYYGFQAFFSTMGRKELRKMPEDDIIFHKRTRAVAKNPNTNIELLPTPLDGDALQIPVHRDPRIELARWICRSDNPFFAKMLVNRYWKHFFGRGLVDPEDDMRITNPPTHPKLLDDLAASFVASGYDLKQLCRTICNSHTYHRSSFPNADNGDDEQNFARYYPRRMSAEVMLDAINDVAGAKNSFNKQPVGVRAVALPDDAANRESFFLRVFGRPQMDTACECERTTTADLAQSLHLINSDAMHKILGASGGRADQWSREPDAEATTRVTDLYLLALSRQPTEAELQIALNHVQKKRMLSATDPQKLPLKQAVKEAYEDIIWVVVNTKEFLFNH